MGIVGQVAKRCTCARTPKGAVLVKDHRIIATGYIGSVAGQPHCDEAGHQMVDRHCVRTIHAEANAIAQAARHGISTEGATCYTTVLPCWTCLKLLINSGIARVVWKDPYLPQPGDPAETSHAEIVRLALECATDLEAKGLFKLERWESKQDVS
jgi:dCMP deaminase